MINKEILIIHTWGLGDMILLTPVLNALMIIHPELSWFYLIFPRIAAEPVIRRQDTSSVLLADRKLWSLFRAVRKLRSKRFYAVMLSSGVRPWKAWVMLLGLRAQYRILEIRACRYPFIQKQIAWDSALSRTQSNYRMLECVLDLPQWDKVFADKAKYQLYPSFPLENKHLSYAHEYRKAHVPDGTKLTIIHPGCMAKNKYRRWKQEYFAELIVMIKNKLNHTIIIVSGPDELDVAEYLRDKCQVPLLYEKELAKVAAVLSVTDYFINTDSGIGHLASCFNVKMLTIFGPGDERQTAPFSETSRIIRNSLDCTPCIGKKRIKCEVECLNELKPEEVFAAFMELIS